MWGHRELGMTPSSPAWDTVTFLMFQRSREMKQEEEEMRDPVRWPRQRESVSEMWRDMGRPRRQGDPRDTEKQQPCVRDVDQKTLRDIERREVPEIDSESWIPEAGSLGPRNTKAADGSDIDERKSEQG